MAATTSYQPDAFNAFVVLLRYAESQARKNATEPSPDFDPSAIIGALRKLYNIQSDSQHLYLNAPALLAGLEQTLAQSGQVGLLGNLEVSETLQIVGLLLDAIMADSAIPVGVIPYYKRLQFPLLIAAFADPTLLEARNHPARELLNQLAYLSLATSAKGNIDNPQLLQSVEQTIGLVTIDSASEPGVFAKALDALSKLTMPLIKSFAMRLERVIDNAIGKDDPPTQLSQTHFLELKKFMLEGLYSVGTEPSTPNRLADELEKLLMHDGGNKAIDYVTVPPSDTERDERGEQLRIRLQGFNIGQWLKFASEGNVWMPLRLTWMGQDPPRYVFVNQKGMKTLDLDAEKFAQMIDDRRASRIESLEEFPVVERAAKSLLYTLRERMR